MVKRRAHVQAALPPGAAAGLLALAAASTPAAVRVAAPESPVSSCGFNRGGDTPATPPQAAPALCVRPASPTTPTSNDFDAAAVLQAALAPWAEAARMGGGGAASPWLLTHSVAAAAASASLLSAAPPPCAPQLAPPAPLFLARPGCAA